MSNLSRKKILEKIQAKSIGFEDKDQTKSELLLIARDLHAISPEEFDASSPQKFRVIKCYLWTLLKDQSLREQFDKYVILYSKLWCRAHFTMNLLCHKIVGIPLARPQVVDENNLWWTPRVVDSDPRPSTYIYDKIFGSSSTSNTFLRQTFFPEYFPTKVTPLDENIHQCMTEHRAILSHLAPNDWETLMKRSGWANVMMIASVTMKTTIDLYIRKSVIRCSKEFVKLLQHDNQEELYKLLSKPWPNEVPIGVASEVIEQIQNLRLTIGMKEDDYLPEFAESSTEDLVDLHFHFAKIGVLKRHLMPVSQLGRKHATLDSKIARHLFSLDSKRSNLPDHEVLHFLGFSMQSLNESSNLKRKQLRKNQGVNGKYIRRKWKRKGKFKKPMNSVVSSVLSDGVGLSLRYSVPLDIQSIKNEREETNKRKREKKKKQEIDILQMRREDNGVAPTFVGIDGGRAKLFCASTAKKGKPKISVVSYTRKHYYWDIGHARRQKEELEKVENNVELRTAREALSLVGMEHNILSFIQVQYNHSAVLIREAIESKFYSFRKMRSFRLRKSALSRACNALIDFGKERGRRLVLGIGDAGFASTGRGEKAAPVKSITRSLDEVIKTRNMHQKNNQQGSISSLTINEFRTTLICSSCCSITTQPWVQKPNGSIYKSSRLRRCKNCDPINGKLRDRDIQASRNILRLTGLEYYGFPRPPELSRQKKSSKSRV